MAKQKNTIIYLIAALLFLGGVGYLVYSALSGKIFSFSSPSRTISAGCHITGYRYLFPTSFQRKLL